MFSGVYRKLRKFVHSSTQTGQGESDGPVERHPLSADIDKNIQQLHSIFSRCSDVVMREFEISAPDPVKAFLIYIDGMTDQALDSEHVMKALQLNPSIIPQGQRLTRANAFNIVKNHLLGTAEIKTTDEMLELVEYVLAGDTALLLDGSTRSIISSAPGMKARNVEEPVSEPVVRGPRDGFTETLRVNTTLIRRRIKTSRLKIENFKVGLLTKTDVVLVYIEGIANGKVVEEVRRRIGRINIDGVIESSYVEEMIEDHPYSPFPQVSVTERPDKVAANLLEGYVAIMVDTTPMALIAPATFPMFLQAAEDYYSRVHFATFIRLLRFMAMAITLFLPSMYVAIVTYHQEMLPTPLLVSIASQREGVPFPAFLEALFMETMFEILREAGIRLPRTIGQAVSIVGALVIGDAAVNAGLVSPAMVMVVSLTAIASFTIPSVGGSYALRLIRFPIMFLAAAFGLFGIMAALMAILFHLCSLRSFGVPYLSPLAPFSLQGMKDILVRVPWWAMLTRPSLISHREPKRQDSGQMPGPHRRGDKTNRARGGKGNKDDA